MAAQDLTPEEIERWRRAILRRLETFKDKARQAGRMLELSGQHTLKDTAELRSLWQAIKDLFPPDFSAPRTGDLNRHLGFAMTNDFYDIENFDIPDIEQAVQRYRRQGLNRIREELETLESDFTAWDLIHPLIRDTCGVAFHGGRYREAARSAVELLMDELRKQSGETTDGEVLVRKAIGDGSSLAFSVGRDANDKSVTEGLKQVLIGLYKGVRNPLSHGWNGFSRLQSFQVMTSCSLILDRLCIPEEAD